MQETFGRFEVVAAQLYPSEEPAHCSGPSGRRVVRLMKEQLKPTSAALNSQLDSHVVKRKTVALPALVRVNKQLLEDAGGPRPGM